MDINAKATAMRVECWHATAIIPSFALLSAMLFGANASAQGTRSKELIPDSASCPKCQIVLEPVVVLLIPADTTDTQPVTVKMDGAERYWVFRRGDVPLLFDREGSLLRSLGHRGLGLGHFVQAHDLLSTGKDSLLVFDGSARRVTVYDDSLRMLGHWTIPIEMHSPVIASWPDVIFASGSVPSPEGSGWPLHKVSFARGEPSVVKSFGPHDGEVTPEWSFLTWHEFTTPGRRGFWTVWVNGYDLSQWSGEGSLLRTLGRRPPWFAGPSPTNWNWRTSPPPPHVAAIQEDDQARLWVLIRVAGRDWKAAWPRVPKEVHEVPARDIRLDRLFGTMIEVIDPFERRVVARQYIDRYVIGVVRDRRVAIHEIDERGNSRVVVVTLRLTPP